MIAYHIDRSETLTEGGAINLQVFNDIEPSYLNEILHAEFPEGVSRHGDQYFASAIPNGGLIGNWIVEAFFEQQRKLKHPDKLSRFQSIFATETIDECKVWSDFFMRNSISSRPLTVWEIEFDLNQCLKFDGSWLTLSPQNTFSFLRGIVFADRYWTQGISGNPMPELLIKPPVIVKRKISL